MVQAKEFGKVEEAIAWKFLGYHDSYNRQDHLHSGENSMNPGNPKFIRRPNADDIHDELKPRSEEPGNGMRSFAAMPPVRLLMPHMGRSSKVQMYTLR